LRTRIHALDGLRAIAALLVVTHHLWGAGSDSGLIANFLQSATGSGVELFFVLSGVVLGPRYIREGRPVFTHDYFRRRVERLWPPYVIAWLLAGLAIGIATAWPTWWSKSAFLPPFDWSAWLGQIFIVNWWSTPYSFAWWIAFYAIFPLLIPGFRVIRQRPAIVLSVFCGTLCLSAFAYNRISVPVVRDLVNYASCFAAGIVLATCEVPARRAYLALLSGLLLISAAIILPAVNPHVGWGLFYFGIVATALDQLSDLSQRLSSSFLVWLGERSYSLFLTHHTIIVLTYLAISFLVDAKGPAFYLCTRFISVLFSLLAAMLLFSFVERRFASGLATANYFWPPVRTWRRAWGT
jgi:peptidoglycan/LPS O-acetylase OafA/YrhL